MSKIQTCSLYAISHKRSVLCNPFLTITLRSRTKNNSGFLFSAQKIPRNVENFVKNRVLQRNINILNLGYIFETPNFFEKVWILIRKHEFLAKRPIGSYSAYTLTHYRKKISSKTSEKCRFQYIFWVATNLCFLGGNNFIGLQHKLLPPKKYIENRTFSLVFDEIFFQQWIRVYAEYDPIGLFERNSCFRVNIQTFSNNCCFSILQMNFKMSIYEF